VTAHQMLVPNGSAFEGDRGVRNGPRVTMSRNGCDTMEVDLIYRAAVRGAACWARNHRGQVRELPMARWIGGPDTTPHDRLADELVLARCSARPTLDLGCGPGRFTASLQQRGSAALGVDISGAAVELTRMRGGTAIRGDVFEPLPAEGCWDRVLLTDGNIGIGGDPVRTLQRSADLLAPDGVVVVEIDPASTALCHELLRWETDHHVGQWFPWSRVGAAALGDIAAAAGFLVTNVVEIHARVIAVLAVSNAGEKTGT
jgi:SAM-dependent methyltransferase